MNTPLQPTASNTTSQDDALTLDDLCCACSVQSTFILELLEEGVIEPVQGQALESWRFTAVQAHHVSIAWRLQRDLGVNMPGAAVALQLLDEVETLRAQLMAQPHPTDDVG